MIVLSIVKLQFQGGFSFFFLFFSFLFSHFLRLVLGLWSDRRESACNAGDLGSIHGLEDPLEEGMATHSSILTSRIPWTEEPGRPTVHGVAKSWTRLRD